MTRLIEMETDPLATYLALVKAAKNVGELEARADTPPRYVVFSLRSGWGWLTLRAEVHSAALGTSVLELHPTGRLRRSVPDDVVARLLSFMA